MKEHTEKMDEKLLKEKNWTVTDIVAKTTRKQTASKTKSAKKKEQKLTPTMKKLP